MSNIFLGKPAALAVAGRRSARACGSRATNGGTSSTSTLSFVALLAVSAVCVLIVLYGTRPGERITRDEILPDETEESYGG